MERVVGFHDGHQGGNQIPIVSSPCDYAAICAVQMCVIIHESLHFFFPVNSDKRFPTSGKRRT
jgi:hypothetical protein